MHSTSFRRGIVTLRLHKDRLPSEPPSVGIWPLCSDSTFSKLKRQRRQRYVLNTIILQLNTHYSCAQSAGTKTLPTLILRMPLSVLEFQVRQCLQTQHTQGRYKKGGTILNSFHTGPNPQLTCHTSIQHME